MTTVNLTLTEGAEPGDPSYVLVVVEGDRPFDHQSARAVGVVTRKGDAAAPGFEDHVASARGMVEYYMARPHGMSWIQAVLRSATGGYRMHMVDVVDAASDPADMLGFYVGKGLLRDTEDRSPYDIPGRPVAPAVAAERAKWDV